MSMKESGLMESAGSAFVTVPVAALLPMECLIDGKWMPVTNDILERKGLYEICRFSTFRFNPDLFRIQGVQDKASMKVQLITTAGESIPEMEDDLTIALL